MLRVGRCIGPWSEQGDDNSDKAEQSDPGPGKDIIVVCGPEVECE